MLRQGLVIALALLWGAATLDGAWSPGANFPLNDDWQYAHVAKQFAETGIFKVDVPVAPTLLAQSALGAAVTRAFGFSFVYLRTLTLVLASVLLLLIWGLMRLGRVSTLWSTLTLLILVTNPLWLHLTQSFMTEFYGSVIGFFGVWLWFRAGESPYKRVLAAAVMGSAFWVRQFAVLVFPAVCLAELLSDWMESGRAAALGRVWRKSSHWIWVGLAFVLPIALYFPWAKATGNYNKAFATPFSKILRPALGHFIVQLPILIFYLTAFFLPILAVARWGSLRLGSNRLSWILAVVAVLAWFLGDDPYVIRNTLHRVFPFLGNLMTGYGLGAITLSDVYYNPETILPGSSLIPWLAFELALVIVAGSWLPILFSSWVNIEPGPRKIALFGIVLAALTFLASVQAYLFEIFDRYHFQALLGLALAVPILMTARLPDPKGESKKVALLFGLPWLLWSGFWIAAQHDYLAWNEARWKIAKLAQEKGISWRELDGGYEMNGWLTFEEGRPNAGDPECGVRQIWFCGHRRHQIGLNRTPERQEILREPVRAWLRNFPDLILTKRR